MVSEEILQLSITTINIILEGFSCFFLVLRFLCKLVLERHDVVEDLRLGDNRSQFKRSQLCDLGQAGSQ